MKVYTSEQWIDPVENINIQHVLLPRGGVEPVHQHEFVELVYILSGTGEHAVANRSYRVGKGNLVFVNYKENHSFHADSDMTYMNILVRPAFMDAQLVSSENIYEIFSLAVFEPLRRYELSATSCILFTGTELLELEAVLRNMREEFDGKKNGYRTVLAAYMQIVFALLIRRLQDSDVHNFRSITGDILRYIDENYSKKLTLSELARQCFYNPVYFSRIFKECYCQTVTGYIRSKRIGEAVRLLHETELPVEQIGIRVGYSDKSQFFRRFKEHTGMTPNEMRKSKNQPPTRQ